ncbi:MAG: CinA family nicotinamide mononucleotide deamidase-related protein [Planctomycetota bacterium]|nr:CinA family nicotinamide mononucleotide deamidase-related protein [Planctomycetota bacterium]MDA1179589.1 CinA family nicotinamide mononucleotide deamidase-related protein [Planctomycetota bacterium]
MRVEIIAVGDELVSGQRLDTNSQWLSQRLGELGLPVVAHTTVGDDFQLGVAAVLQAAERADVVVMTGGLGPTADDLTRQCLAEAARVPLVLDEASLRHIENLFARRKRPMPDSNRLQAEFPQGSRVIPNPHGSAPGIDLDLMTETRRSSRIFALPGVPAEMREMWDATVFPALQQQMPNGTKTILHRQIKCFGVGESDLEQILPDLIRRGREPSVGITVHRATITLRITARGSSPADCQKQIAPTEKIIRECLGDLVFGQDDDELEDVVIRRLLDRNKTLTTVECGTSGRLAWWLTRADAEKKAYVGGIVLPSPVSLHRWLNATPVTNHGASRSASVPPDPEFISQIAEEARRRNDCDYALAVGPFPSRDNQTASPQFVFAIADRNNANSQLGPFAGHPDILVDRAAKLALNSLRLAVE